MIYKVKLRLNAQPNSIMGVGFSDTGDYIYFS
jgi:hypothetical protein